MSKAKEVAQKIVAAANRYGWSVVGASGSILKIQKFFEPGNMCQLIDADSEYYDILALCPSVEAGSIWGSDCGGVGAISALEKGLFRMNKSGCSKRVLKEVSKLVMVGA